MPTMTLASPTLPTGDLSAAAELSLGGYLKVLIIKYQTTSDCVVGHLWRPAAFQSRVQLREGKLKHKLVTKCILCYNCSRKQIQCTSISGYKMIRQKYRATGRVRAVPCDAIKLYIEELSLDENGGIAPGLRHHKGLKRLVLRRRQPKYSTARTVNKL
jgi:hypothetical protein